MNHGPVSAYRIRSQHNRVFLVRFEAGLIDQKEILVDCRLPVLTFSQTRIAQTFREEEAERQFAYVL